ncbi:hypothetical protein QMO56_26645 [Roseomonas sp. E05]|uniref:hypothetical protein n=1 Tax=Roseomonas sp. E05 TaxID=3046310 RepID=UPI0024BA7988|nr:hypothetical protein [Roseomonas sp. E05]MDJ0391675.1 hypothetical protein [Roseomonas sp. E05]
MIQRASLMAIASSLRDAYSPLEANFTATGRQLERATSALGGLGCCFEALEEQLRGPQLAEVMGRFEQAAGQVCGIAAVLRSERNMLERMHRQLAAIAGALNQLSGTVRAVGMLTASAKVCASALHETREDFVTFTDEIVRLFELSRSSLGEFQQAATRLLESVRSGLTQQDSFARQQAEALQSIPIWLAESTAAVERRLHAGADTSTEVRARSAAIARQVAESIVALQIADSTRQRVEHVEAALVVLISHDAPKEASEQALVLAHVCHLQAAQLLSAAEDHAAQVQRVDAALNAMAQDARHICAVGSEAYGAGARRDSFLGPLEENVRQALTLLRDFRAAQATVDGMVRGIAIAVAQLAGHIKTVGEVETDLRLMSLNMTLKSGRLHDAGRTLLTIARELRTCADQTTQIVALLTQELTSITELAQDRAARQPTHEEAALEHLDGLMSGAMEKLQAVRLQITHALATLEAEGGEAAAALRAAAANLVVADVPAMLRMAAEKLITLAGAPPPDEAALATVRHLMPAGANYTMASERQVQARLSGSDGPVASAAEDILEDILF